MSIVTKFRSTGICEIDVDLVTAEWDHTWGIVESRWGYVIFKQDPNRRIKVQIPPAQAEEIIDKLSLQREYNDAFPDNITWKTVDENRSGGQTGKTGTRKTVNENRFGVKTVNENRFGAKTVNETAKIDEKYPEGRF